MSRFPRLNKKHCPICEKEFKPRNRYTVACSPECGYESRRLKVIGRKQHKDLFGEKNPRWKGGLIFDKDGYLMRYSPNHPNKNAIKYVREHRLVVEKQIGRYLHCWEIVHHINAIKTDNRIENLKLMSKKEHDKIHDKSGLSVNCAAFKRRNQG